MLKLTPDQAAALADDVYALSRTRTIEEALRYLNDEYNSLLTFHETCMLKGRTGGPAFIKCTTAFGFTLVGKGPYKGQAFILFRGTQYLADWLTNINVMHARSSYNEFVHDGFNTALKSMRPQLMTFLTSAQREGLHTIHCIGHSLGGALATLCGEWIRANYKLRPYIYSFGSPRVGFEGFSRTCAREIGNSRIFRAYHKTDIVPCIPIWPYVHTPNDGTEYYLPSPGFLPGAEYHEMRRYKESVEEKSWLALSGIKPERRSDASIAAWLKKEGPVGVTISALSWIDDAIKFVVRKCLAGADWILSSAVGTYATIMDRLAYMLSQGLTLEENVSAWVLYLMKKIAAFVGRCHDIASADLNQSFIKVLLIELQRKVNATAQTALNQALVNGRAI